MFALACAAATAMPAGHLPPLLAAALVAAGGGFSWLVHMSGALFDVRGPERKAAFALQNAWDVLVNQQPAWGRGSTTVGRLRTLVRGLHLAFADAMGAAGRGASPDPGLAAGVHRLLVQALRPGSEMRRILLRVAIAALLAGGLASLLDLERAYWAVAAAVLLLFQGFDWVRMLARSTERLLGTWVGLLLGGAIIAWHPQGLALVLVVMALQFCVEMLVMRNYATAVVFITGAALTLASGARRPLGRRRQRRHPARSRDPAARARARSAGTARVPHPRAAGARAHRGAVEWCAGGRTPLRTRTPCTPRSTTTPAAARRATRSR